MPKINQTSLIKNIRTQLKKFSSKQTADSFQRFFKENALFYGVKSADVGKIARNSVKEVTTLSKKDVFEVCEKLFISDYCEEFWVGGSMVYSKKDEFTEQDIEIFERWILKYVNNWAKCDTFCNHSVGDLVDRYPQLIQKLKEWTKSRNMWLQRASAVSLIVPAKDGKYLKDAFEITEALLDSKEDLVQKGYGWLLKEESRKHPQEVFNFLMKHRTSMPRTAFRYALEKMPKELKEQAMKK